MPAYAVAWWAMLSPLCPAQSDLQAPIAQPSPADRQGVEVIAVGGAAGLGSFSSGRWGVVRMVVSNRTAEAARVTAEVHRKSDPELRFSRELWLPAWSERTSAIPFHLSAEVEPASRFEFVGRVISGTTVPHRVGTRLAQTFGPIATAYLDDATVGVASDVTKDDADWMDIDPAYEAFQSLMASQGFARLAATCRERLLPATVEAWQPVGHVVVTGKRLSQELAAAAALGRWVSEGGRMWIQLNRSDVETVHAMFGSTVGIGVVDRVPLTNFVVRGVGKVSDAISAELDLEEPVELIRARIEGGTTLFEVDGWPAAVHFSYGRGQVFLTLLDAHGWIRPPGPDDPVHPDPLRQVDFIARDPLHELADRFYQQVDHERTDPDVIAEYVSSRIGYEIPGRAGILATLAGVCGAILCGGLWLAALGRLEYLAAVTSVTTLAGAAVLVWIGRTSVRDVPPMLAEFRLVRVQPDTDSFEAEGAVATFEPELTRVDLRGHGVRAQPQTPQLRGQIREWTWSDGTRWRWDGTRLPPGVTLLPIESEGTLRESASAIARFGPAGLQGEFRPGGLTQLSLGGGDVDADAESGPDAADRPRADEVTFEDGLLVFPNAMPLAANLRPGGSFAADESDRLAEGQFFNATMLGDEQRRRSKIFEQWLTQRQQVGPLGRPVLLCWARGERSGLHTGRGVRQSTSSMVIIPVQLERPPVGTAVRIPSPAIRLQSVRAAQGHSVVFDNQFERWNYPDASARVVRLRFQMPESLLPLRLEEATLRLDCHLPSRRLEISLVGDGPPELLASSQNASGIVETKIDRPQRLTLDDGGGLTLEISVGELQTEVAEETLGTAGWSIRSSRLRASGVTLPIPVEREER